MGITPDGTVYYVSSLYGGAASDKFIVHDSGVLDLLELGDNVMAVRDFETEVELKRSGAILNIPPFRNQHFQLSCEQVKAKWRIADARIHVEHAIQRLAIKNFPTVGQNSLN